MKMPVTAKDILDSDGKFPDRRQAAANIQRANAAELASRVNALLLDLGIMDRPVINSGLRNKAANIATNGAKNSAHLEGKALDFADEGHKLSLRITSKLLAKHKLRREDTDYAPNRCHLDTRLPYGSIFKP